MGITHARHPGCSRQTCPEPGCDDCLGCPCRTVDLAKLGEIAAQRAAQSELLWDLGALLPEGHPFAPVVEGQHAA